jgi:OOP family OmpA-OmpF porin
MTNRLRIAALLIGVSFVTTSIWAQDVPGSRDPAGMKRYEGSELIGYRGPKFDEFLLPLGPPTDVTTPKYEKSLKVEGLVSFYTYLAPTGRTNTELIRNYKQEFQRMGLTVLYEKGSGERGWFGPGLQQVEKDSDIGDILNYNESQERVLVAKSKDAAPTYYWVLVTVFRDGNMPDRLRSRVVKDRAIAQLVVVAPEKMETKMAFVNAADMSKALGESGKVILYGVYFDNDKDTVGADSKPTLQEIAKLLTANPKLRIQVVGHTDNQGTPDHNLDLSRRRAASVVKALISSYGVADSRLSSFGCGPYSPAAANDTEEGRAKNRRVELVKW